MTYSGLPVAFFHVIDLCSFVTHPRVVPVSLSLMPIQAEIPVKKRIAKHLSADICH